MCARRAPLRHCRVARPQGYEETQEEEEEEESPPSTVRQQLQAKVSHRLNNRGVNTSDRWQAKPKGQLTAEDERRLERQRENKRRWARKERERSRKELEALIEKNDQLQSQNQDLRGQIDELKKQEYKMITFLTEHECKRPATKVVFVVPFPRSPRSRDRQWTRLHREKLPRWKPVGPCCPSSQGQDPFKPATDSSPQPHHTPNIEAILKSASKVSASMTLHPHQSVSGEGNDISSVDWQSTADQQTLSQNHGNQTTVRQCHVQPDDSVTRQMMQSGGFSVSEVIDTPEILSELFQEDDFTTSTMSDLSILPLETDFHGIDVENLSPMALESNAFSHDTVMCEELFTDIAGENKSIGQSQSSGSDKPSVSNDLKRNVLLSPPVVVSNRQEKIDKNYETVPGSSLFLPGQVTATTTAISNSAVSTNMVFSDEKSVKINNNLENESVQVKVRTGNIADIVTSSTRSSPLKRSESWDNNSLKTQRSIKRRQSLFLSHSMSGSTFYENDDTTHDVPNTNITNENVMDSSTDVQTFVMDSQPEREEDVTLLQMTQTWQSEIGTNDSPGGKAQVIVFVPPDQVAASPTTRPSPDPGSPFRDQEVTGETEEVPDDGQWMGMTVEEDTAGSLEGVLCDMPVLTDEESQLVLQMLDPPQA